jgi:nifR3 family TIM-barrel protein
LHTGINKVSLVMTRLFDTDDFTVGSLTVQGRVILAPLAGITDGVFRIICRRNGAALCITEMVSADGLVRKNRKTIAMIETAPEDRPIGVQLFGSEPAVLADAAKIVEDAGADVIDLNVGCPVKKVVKRGAGAALLDDLPRLRRMISGMVAAVKIPVTVKIRSGIHADKPVAVEVGKMGEAEGAAAIGFHPRSLSQGFTGQADWRLIEELVNAVSIPVIGSGDIFTVDDAIEMVTTTGCDAVMVARGVLGNPHLIRQIDAGFRGQPISDNLPYINRLDALMEYFDMTVEAYGEPWGVRRMRGPMSWYVKGMPGAAAFRREMMRIDDAETVRNALLAYRKHISKS